MVLLTTTKNDLNFEFSLKISAKSCANFQGGRTLRGSIRGLTAHKSLFPLFEKKTQRVEAFVLNLSSFIIECEYTNTSEFLNNKN